MHSNKTNMQKNLSDIFCIKTPTLILLQKLFIVYKSHWYLDLSTFMCLLKNSVRARDPFCSAAPLILLV